MCEHVMRKKEISKCEVGKYTCRHVDRQADRQVKADVLSLPGLSFIACGSLLTYPSFFSILSLKSIHSFSLIIDPLENRKSGCGSKGSTEKSWSPDISPVFIRSSSSLAFLPVRGEGMGREGKGRGREGRGREGRGNNRRGKLMGYIVW